MLLLATRFLAELAGVVALGYWGFASFAMPWRVVAGLGAPVHLVVAWALVVAPNADNPFPGRVRELIGTALLVGTGVALAAAGQPLAGLVLAAVVILDQALLIVLDPQVPAALAGDRR